MSLYSSNKTSVDRKHDDVRPLRDLARGTMGRLWEPAGPHHQRVGIVNFDRKFVMLSDGDQYDSGEKQIEVLPVGTEIRITVVNVSGAK